MNVNELRRLADLDNSKIIRIYNPDTEDFTVKYEGKPYTIHALEMQEYPFVIANHIKKHLADHLLNKRGFRAESNPQDALLSYMKEIEVSLE